MSKSAGAWERCSQELADQNEEMMLIGKKIERKKEKKEEKKNRKKGTIRMKVDFCVISSRLFVRFSQIGYHFKS